MGDWSLLGGMGPHEMHGLQSSTTLTTVTSGAANTKGAVVSLGTAVRTGLLTLYVQSNGQGDQALIDVCLDNTPTNILISNLLCCNASTGYNTSVYQLPILVKAGQEIFVRMQNTGAGVLYAMGFSIIPLVMTSAPGLNRSWTLGGDLTNSCGTLVARTGTNSKSNYTTFGTTPDHCKMLMMVVGVPGNPVTARAVSSKYYLDICAGSAVLVADISFTITVGAYPPGPFIYPLSLPAGTVLQTRFQTSGTSNTSDIYPIFYGFL
jgi:hypothetical protein